MSKVYLVQCLSGEWSDTCMWIVKAFKTKDQAEDRATKLNAWYKSWLEDFRNLTTLNEQLAKVYEGSELDPYFADKWNKRYYTDYFVTEVDYED